MALQAILNYSKYKLFCCIPAGLINTAYPTSQTRTWRSKVM